MHILDIFQESDRSLKEFRERIQEVKSEQDRVNCDITAMEAHGSVVTDTELGLCRESRNAQWQLIKRAWLEGEDVSNDASLRALDTPLPEAYETSVRDSDDVADRLRSEAERVHAYTGLKTQREKLSLQLSQWQERERQAIAEQTAQGAAWKNLWQESGIEPTTPRKMRDWLECCTTARRDAGEMLAKEALIMPYRAQRSELYRLLAHELKMLGVEKTFPGEEVEPLREYAAQLFEEMNTIRSERIKLQEEIGRLRAERHSAGEALERGNSAMETWRLQWQEALQGLWLSEGCTPEEAMEAMENLRSCLEQRDLANSYQHRMDEIDRHSQVFSHDVTQLVTSIAPELSDYSPEQAVVKLQSMLTDARKTTSVREKISEDIKKAADALHGAETEQRTNAEAMKAMEQRTGCVTDDEFSALERDFKEYEQHLADLNRITRDLMELSDGIALDLIERQAAEVDPDELPTQIASRETRLHDELGPRIKFLSEKKGAGRIQLELMDGGDKAAEMLEKAEAALASVKRLAGRYVRFKVAGQILKREIDLYRREHQDPVLKVASRYFSELTCAAYGGLKTDVDENGHPILVGVTSDGRGKTVELMSSGTRDQLYLSLRLATIERRLERHQPLPFIADDLLVNFDDVRSAATLRALSELGTKNQVILFTHHRQILTIAESLGQKERIYIHEL